MDITPKPTPQPDLKNSRPLTIDATAVSQVDELKLEKEALYRAKVVQVLSEQKSPIDAETKESNQSQIARELLLRINGKLARISTDQPFTAGQTLTVKLGSSGSNQTNALVIVNEIKSSDSLRPIGKAAENQTLLNSLSRLLPKQLSLTTGFSALSQIYKILETSQTSSTIDKAGLTQPAKDPVLTNSPPPSTDKSGRTPGAPSENLSKVIIEKLLQSLPRADQITSDITSKRQMTTNQAINNSGALLESSLSATSAREKLVNQLQHLRSLTSEQSLEQLNQSLHKSASRQSDAQTQNSNLTSSTTTNSKQALNLLQQLIKNSDNKTAPADSNGATSIPNDLKAQLLGFSRLISSSLANEASQSQKQVVEKLLANVIEPDLLSSPFNFPRTASETSSKAKALLADQEFSTGQLLKILAGMLNRIQFNQLNSLYQSQNNDGNTLQTWFFELPVINTSQEVSTFSIRIDKEKNSSQQREENSDEQALQWKLSLSFDLEELGAVYIQVSLLPPTVSSIIWADNEDTYHLANSEIEHFKTKLSDLGLEVGDILCQKGLPPQRATKLTQSLVDVQA